MTQDNANDERRHFKRIPFDAEVELSSSSGRWRSRLIDLSLNGALVEQPTGWADATGEPCLLHIHLGGNDISIHMEVMAAHAEHPEGARPGKIGLRCTHIDIDSIAHLRRFVELNLGDAALLNRELSALGETHDQQHTSANNQPDWGRIAEKFDLWLPQLAPVGETLLAALNAQAGDIILDVASGTGEPALTLARRMGNTLKITGTDAAEPMVKVAQKKAAQENLPHIQFQHMPAEKLLFDDSTFDKIMCRFGVMLFDDSLQGLREMNRVLKPGGRFSIAVWSTPQTMPTMYWAHQVFKDRVPPEKHPPLAKVTSLGAPGALDTILRQAGFTDFTIRAHTFNYRFPSFNDYWDIVEQSDIMKMQYDALAAGEKDKIREEVAALAQAFTSSEGLIIPHEFLLAEGGK